MSEEYDCDMPGKKEQNFSIGTFERPKTNREISYPQLRGNREILEVGSHPLTCAGPLLFVECQEDERRLPPGKKTRDSKGWGKKLLVGIGIKKRSRGCASIAHERGKRRSLGKKKPASNMGRGRGRRQNSMLESERRVAPWDRLSTAEKRHS